MQKINIENEKECYNEFLLFELARLYKKYAEYIYNSKLHICDESILKFLDTIKFSDKTCTKMIKMFYETFSDYLIGQYYLHEINDVFREILDGYFSTVFFNSSLELALNFNDFSNGSSLYAPANPFFLSNVDVGNFLYLITEDFAYYGDESVREKIKDVIGYDESVDLENIAYCPIKSDGHVFHTVLPLDPKFEILDHHIILIKMCLMEKFDMEYSLDVIVHDNTEVYNKYRKILDNIIETFKT